VTSKLLIVGAGIAGLSLARRLSHYGLGFEIIERNSSEHRTGAGIALPFNAVRELEKLDVMDDLAGKYHQVEKITYSTAAGKTLGTASLLDPPFGNDKFIALKRQDLHLSLLKGFEKKVRFNTELLSIEHVEDKTAVTCSNELLNGKYDLVIAADGINSRIREQNYEGQATLLDHKIVCWRFIVTLPEHGLQPLYMMGNTDLFMAYPISPNALYCYGHIHEQNPHYDADSSPEKNVRQIFAGYAGPVPDILSKLDEVTIETGRLKSVSEPRFFDRRIAFIGDAANGCSPLIQQGAAAALEDTDCLSDALAMQNIDQALQSYQERRQSRIEWIMQYSDRPLTHIQKFDTLFGRRIRNLLIRTLGPVNVRGWKKLARDSRRLV
jgi:2-polyprenyl-6-methoxyphenol hydroxylase-like FAD-dependent oxidoreductase